MARYDRIAPLNSPGRDHAFPAWPVLRDIEGQDRDADVCRRARLRFLALRPVRRLIDRRPGVLSAESYHKQIEAVREELSSLSLRDIERARVSRFLRQIEDRDPQRLVAALLEFAEQAHSAGHDHAAEEYAATANLLRPHAADALLARIRSGDLEGQQDYAAALERGWNELRHEDDVAKRARILDSIGRALIELQMYAAADRCFGMLVQRSGDLSLRARARAAHALLAGLTGQRDVFRERRGTLLNDHAEWAPDPRVAAGIHIDLARGSVATADLDFAREHVRTAITLARQHRFDAALKRAEVILTALEQNTEVLLQPQSSNAEAERIAAQIELLQLPTPAT